MSKSFKIFSLFTVCVAFAVIVLGGVVRVTGSGLACPDWPLCHGQIIPPLEIPTWIEWTHRLTTALVSASLLGMVVWATLKYRQEKIIFLGAWLAVLLLISQIVLGAMVVRLELPALAVGVHLGNALLIFATLLTISVFSVRPWRTVPVKSDPALRRLILLCTLAVYGVIFSGAVVTGSGSTAACLAWPLCNGEVVPQTAFQAINLTHRYFAAGVGILLFYTLWDTVRKHRANRALRRAAHSAVGLFGLQILVGGINVLALFHPAWNALHLAVATAVWGGMVVFAVIGWQTLRESSAQPQVAGKGIEVGRSQSLAR